MGILAGQAIVPEPPETHEASGRDRLDLDQSYLRRKTFPAAVCGTTELKIIDLFSGCGGLTLGALEGARRMSRRARLALAVDNDRAPLEVLKTTLGESDGRCQVADLAKVLAPFDGRRTNAEKELFGRGAGAQIL